MALTCISFLFFMSSGPGRNRGGAPTSYGTIYGHELTAEEIGQAKRDFELFYLINSGEWPDKNRNMTEVQIDQQTYLNIMFAQKAKSLGVFVPDAAVADAAAQVLHSQALSRAFGANGQAVRMDQFLDGIKPRGYTAADFEHAIHSQLIVEQLRLTLGLSGSLVTPQEAAMLYDYEHREAYSQAVFFSASNYLGSVTVTPAAVAEFYTNSMAYYRLPDRVQVNYVWFNITNYLDLAKTELTKSNNFETVVDNDYKQYSTAPEFKDAKTPEAAKAMIREALIRKRAAYEAGTKAEEFKKALWSMDSGKADSSVNAQNIVTLARQFGLTSSLSRPFGENSQPDEFVNAPAVVSTAFTKISADSPFSDLIGGEDGYYLIGLANQLPSSIPSFAEIHDRVEQDFRAQSALALATRAGTNFDITAGVQLAVGKSFAQAAVAEGQTPVILSPFSLSTADVPEAGNHADARELKQAAFGTTPGRISRFISTADGGFVLYLQKIEAVDTSKSSADLAAYTSQIRRARENEAFNLWVNSEASRELHSFPAFAPKTPGAPN